MVLQNAFFGMLAALAVVSALRVVTTRNVVHAALYLVMVLASVAALFVLLAAEFVAAVQILVYVGAIVVLFLFGVMLTRAQIGADLDLDNGQRGLAALVALVLGGTLTWALIDAFGDDKLPELSDADVAARGVRPVGDAIFSTYLVPFEVVSILLLAALIGAIVLARRD